MKDAPLTPAEVLAGIRTAAVTLRVKGGTCEAILRELAVNGMMAVANKLKIPYSEVLAVVKGACE